MSPLPRTAAISFAEEPNDGNDARACSALATESPSGNPPALQPARERERRAAKEMAAARGAKGDMGSSLRVVRSGCPPHKSHEHVRCHTSYISNYSVMGFRDSSN